MITKMIEMKEEMDKLQMDNIKKLPVKSKGFREYSK